jgi:hypothetical protein
MAEEPYKTTPPIAKVCVSCSEAKPLDAYTKDAATRDGKRRACRQCEAVALEAFRNGIY